MNLGETIYQYRVSKNFSQGDLANMLDVSRQSVSKWENNSAVPDLDKIVKLCEIFEISIDELVKGKHAENAIEPQAIKISISESESFTKTKSNHSSSGQKTAGTILLSMAFLTVLICSFMGGFLVGLICCIPLLICGIICFIFKRNAGLWCSWAIYFLVDTYLRFATGAQRNSIYNIYYLTSGERYLTITVILGWALFLSLAVLTWITVLRFKGIPFEMSRRNKILLCAAFVIAIIIKVLQLILPVTAYYSYYLAHILDLSVVHTIIYGIVDWIKVVSVIVLIVNLSRYKFKITSFVAVGVVLLSLLINFGSNLILSKNLEQNFNHNSAQTNISANDMKDKSLYEHGLDIVGMLNEIVNSEEYVQAFSGSPDVLNVIKDISKGNYFIPEVVYKITLDAESILEISEMLPQNASENLKTLTKNRLLNTIVTQINSRGGVNKLAATSICTAGKTFVNKEIEEEMIYLYTFEDAAPIAITFTMGENDSVNANGSFVLFDELDSLSTQELLEYLGVFSVEVDIVSE